MSVGRASRRASLYLVVSALLLFLYLFVLTHGFTDLPNWWEKWSYWHQQAQELPKLGEEYKDGADGA